MTVHLLARSTMLYIYCLKMAFSYGCGSAAKQQEPYNCSSFCLFVCLSVCLSVWLSVTDVKCTKSKAEVCRTFMFDNKENLPMICAIRCAVLKSRGYFCQNYGLHKVLLHVAKVQCNGWTDMHVIMIMCVKFHEFQCRTSSSIYTLYACTVCT